MKDVYQEVTNKIISALENVEGSWEMPWHKVGGGMPYNIASKKPYRGINIALLYMEGRSSAIWATYKQWKDKGFQVQKGEKGTQIVFFKPVSKKETNSEGNEEEKKFLIAKQYTVFNAEQTDYVDDTPVIVMTEAERIANAETYIKNTGAEIKHGGNKAFYSPSYDMVQMPNREQFKTTDGYYSVMFHELTHWTGSKKRADRDLSGRFGDNKYAAEELVAEMGAAFVCNNLSITTEPREDHAKYIKSWLKVLKDDKRAVFTAASKAQAAVDYLDSLQEEESAAA